MSQAVKINWKDQAKIRNRAAREDNVKGPLFYLLMPEVHRLIGLEPDREKQLLYLVLWFTGARLSDVLLLTPSSFAQTSVGVLVRFSKEYAVPVRDVQFRTLLMKHLKEGHTAKHERIWPVTRQTVNRWHKALVEVANKKAAFKGMRISLLTYRHSFAMNWLIHSAPVHLLETIMGFKHVDRVAHYIQYLEYDQDKYFKAVRFR